MKDLRVVYYDGSFLIVAKIDVDGVDFVQTFNVPVMYVAGISLIDDEETRKRKEEEENERRR